jgi:two-component system, NtrC family, sensor kinase
MSTSTAGTNDSADALTRMLERERFARKQAETLLEEKSRLLYQANLELIQSSKALEREAKRTKAIFDTAAEGIIIFEHDGKIEALNEAARVIFGLDSSDCSELNICALLPQSSFCKSDNRECFIHNLMALTSERSEILGQRADGASIPVEFVVSAFHHGDRTSYSGIVRDLTRRKALESQLAHAQKLESVGQLAAGIAHELNTPIQFVGDNTRFLKESFQVIEEILLSIDRILLADAGSETTQKTIDSIKQTYKLHDVNFVREEIPLAIDQTLQGADNVARIVRAMKVFSHPGTKEFQEVDLNSSLESTITVSRNEWKYCASVETHLSPNLPRIMCLPGELNQAFLNLIVNGAHAIQAKKLDSLGKLTISTRVEDDFVIIDIEDSGNRDSGRDSRSNLRSILHDERRWERNRPGACDLLQHRGEHARWQDHL